MASLMELAGDSVADHGCLFSQDAFASLPSSVLQYLMFKLSAADLVRLEDILTSREFDVDSAWRRHCEALGKRSWRRIEDDFGQTKYMTSYKSIYHYRQFHSLLALLIMEQRCSSAIEHSRRTPLEVYYLALNKVNVSTALPQINVENCMSSYKAFLLKWSMYCEKLVLNGSDIRYIVSDEDLLKEIVKHLKFLSITVFSRHSLQDTRQFLTEVVVRGSVEQVALPGPSTMTLKDEEISELMAICSGCQCGTPVDLRPLSCGGGAGSDCVSPMSLPRDTGKPDGGGDDGGRGGGGGHLVGGFASSSTSDTVSSVGDAHVGAKRKADEQGHSASILSSKRRKTPNNCSSQGPVDRQANCLSVCLTCNGNVPSCRLKDCLNACHASGHLSSAEADRGLGVLDHEEGLVSYLQTRHPVASPGGQETVNHVDNDTDSSHRTVMTQCGNDSSHRTVMTQCGNDGSHRAIMTQCGNDSSHITAMTQCGNESSHRTVMTQCGNDSSHRTVMTQCGNDSSHRTVTTQCDNDSSHRTVTTQCGNVSPQRTVATQYGQVDFRYSGGVQGFILNGNSAAGAIISRVLPHWTNLRRLSIHFNEDVKDVIMTLVGKRQLTHLVLEDTQNSSVFESLVRVFTDRFSCDSSHSFQPMQLCQISVSSEITCSHGPLTVRKNLSAVRVLDLSGNQFGAEGLRLLLSFIRADTALQYLKLSSCGLAASDSCSVLRALNNRDTFMEALNISDNQMDADGCGPMLLKFLAHNLSLRKLAISNVRLSKVLDGHPEVVDALADHPTLEVLDISRNQLGNSHLKLFPLERILSTSTAMRDLNIEMNQYKGSDLIGAADRMSRLSPFASTRLDTLHLSNNFFTLREQASLTESFSKFAKIVLVLCTGMYHESLEHLAQM